MADTKKEHYVPRCYLGNFEDCDGRVHVFDKIAMHYRHQKKEEIAHENYFYDVNFEEMMRNATPAIQKKLKQDIKAITGIDNWEIINSTILMPKYIEKVFLHGIEDEYSTLLKTIIQKSYEGNQWVMNNCSPFSSEEKKQLSFFMAIQIIRTKMFRDTITQTVEKLLQTILFKQQMDDANSRPKETFKIRLNPDYAKLQQLGILLDENKTSSIANIFLNHIWVMKVNKTDTPFYTSDHPIVTIPHKTDQNMSYGGFSSEGVEIAYPISPNLLIAIYESKWHSKSHKDRAFEAITHREEVEYYNQNQVAHCFRCVFSQKKNFELAEELCKKYPAIRDPNNRINIE